MPQETETKRINCPKCGHRAKETVTTQIDLLDFGYGPIPAISVIKKDVDCEQCKADEYDSVFGVSLGGDIIERYQDDD